MRVTEIDHVGMAVSHATHAIGAPVQVLFTIDQSQTGCKHREIIP